MVNVSASVTWSERLFQICGPAKLNARPLRVDSRKDGTSRVQTFRAFRNVDAPIRNCLSKLINSKTILGGADRRYDQIPHYTKRVMLSVCIHCACPSKKVSL